MSQLRNIHYPAWLLVGALFLLAVLNPAPSTAQKGGRVTEVMLTATPEVYDGPCPAQIKFVGRITTDGPVTVRYTFARSDRAMGPIETLNFERAGTKEVSTTWTLGSVGQGFSEWEYIEVREPNKLMSNRAGFKGSCGGQRQSNTRQLPGSLASQQQKQIPPIVLQSLQRHEKTAAARANARKQAFDADRARFEPMANALAQEIRAAGVDLDGYLAASKEFVETHHDLFMRSAKSAGDAGQSTVRTVNDKFAAPIRAVIAKAVNVPGIGDLVEQVQSGGCPFDESSAQPPTSAGASDGSSCCSTNRFDPPFQGQTSERELGATAVDGTVEIRQLSPTIRSAIAAGPHQLLSTGKRITVPDNARYVSVTVALGTSWVIGLSGLGYSHVWFGLDMDVSAGSSNVTCRAPHLEQDNQWTWAGGYLTLSDHRPGPNVTRTCEFRRNPGDPTEYVVNVTATSDGTFVGFAGGYGDYFIDLGPVSVTSCP